MDDEQFSSMIAEHVDMVHNLARRLTDTREQAEDLVQETVLLAWRGWSRPAGAPTATATHRDRSARPENPRTWLATICLNASRDAYRRSRSRPSEVLRAEPDLAIAGPELADVTALANLDAQAVHSEIRRLNPDQRQAIVLMDLAGFTAADAASILGVPRSTVLSRVHRGHKALAAALRGRVDRR